jgi:hypothetical protein
VSADRLRRITEEATPAPWFAIGTSVSKPEVDIVEWAYRDMPPADEHECVARAEANARLIALAPDLAVLVADAADLLRAEWPTWQPYEVRAFLARVDQLTKEEAS